MCDLRCVKYVLEDSCPCEKKNLHIGHLCMYSTVPLKCTSCRHVHQLHMPAHAVDCMVLQNVGQVSIRSCMCLQNVSSFVSMASVFVN